MPPLTPMRTAELLKFQDRYRATLIAANHPSDHVPCEVWSNNIYEVFVYRGTPANLESKDGSPTGWPEMIWLSIKRYDRQAIHDWRHFQTIKNQVIGEEHDAIEIYPKESRLVDMANQYHLWVFADPTLILPCGFIQRKVTEKPEGILGQNAVQREF